MFLGVMDALEAELWNNYNGLLKAWNGAWRKFVVQFDSKVVVQSDSKVAIEAVRNAQIKSFRLKNLIPNCNQSIAWTRMESGGEEHV